MPQSTTAHSHGPNTTPHVGPHGHNLAVQSQGPTVVQGHVHPPTSMTSTQGQQFQRLKVHLHGQIHKLQKFVDMMNSPMKQIKNVYFTEFKKVYY